MSDIRRSSLLGTIALVSVGCATVALLSSAACGPVLGDERPTGDVTSAIEDGDMELLESLVEAGVNINAVRDGISGYTPLHEAADAGNVEAIEFLIASGADTERMSTAGVTPLLLAIGAGHEDAALALINGGADVDRPDGNGTTPLAYARALGRSRVVAELQARRAR